MHAGRTGRKEQGVDISVGGGPACRQPPSLPPNRHVLSCRRKLEAEGWAVPKTESTVPIPGVNMPLDGDYRTLGLEGRDAQQ